MICLYYVNKIWKCNSVRFLHNFLRIWRHVIFLIIVICNTLHYNSCRYSTLNRILNSAYKLLSRNRLVRVIMFHSLSKFSRNASSLNSQSTHNSWLSLRILLNIFNVVASHICIIVIVIILDLFNWRKLHL